MTTCLGTCFMEHMGIVRKNHILWNFFKITLLLLLFQIKDGKFSAEKAIEMTRKTKGEKYIKIAIELATACKDIKGDDR